MSRVALIVLLAALVSCRDSYYQAKLADGDTVTLVRAVKGHELIVRKDGQAAKIRLVGIYTFDATVQEKNDITGFGRLAVDFVSSKAQGAALKISLERPDPDPRGRYLGFVDVAGADLGALLVQEGYAAVYTEYPFSREANYFAAENPARAGVRGVWGGTAARKRLRALRETWAAVRAREGRGIVADPLAEAAP